jgi:phosphoribosylformylglycinamidine synthase
VAECWRNLTAVGATPLALTDNLNFGNPEKPDYMGQFVGCLEGIGDAARALDFPIVSGNVSLYNETQGRGILPTPSIGGVGRIDDVAKAASLSFKAAGEAILLVGETRGWLGQSMYLWQVCGREEGAPPPVDLAAERRNGDFVRGLIGQGTVTAVHDLSDGGLAVALAEMAMAGGVGAAIDAAAPDMHGFLFGEDQARYVLTARPQDVGAIEAAARAAGVPLQVIGRTGAQSLTLPGESPIPISTLSSAHEGWLPAYMAASPK